MNQSPPPIHSRKTQPWRGRAIAGLALANLIITLSTGTVAAAAPTFGQKILPMDCVFETINDGTDTLHYLTPATCGVVVTPSPTAPDIPILSPQTNSNLSAGSLAPTDLSSNSPANNLDVQLPWQQLVTQSAAAGQAAPAAPSHVNGIIIAAAAISIIAIITLIVFLL